MADISRRTLIIIPARGGSKRAPRKNFRTLGDRPLLAWAADIAHGVKNAHRVILTSENEELLQLGASVGLETPFKRPPELATDTVQLPQVVDHAYRWFKERGEVFDCVASLQPTNPFLASATVEKAIDTLFETGCDAVTTVAEVVDSHPYICKRMGDSCKIEDFCEIPLEQKLHRHLREVAYRLTGSLYVRSRRLLEEVEPQGHWLGEDVRGVPVTEVEAIDINSELDFAFADFVARHGAPA